MNLVQAWNFIKAAAENSQGNLQYHQTLQEAIRIVAEELQKAVEPAEDIEIE